MVTLTEMVVSIAGGLGLFLLGMAVMTEGLKALAGSALRRVLARAAASPVRGTFWGAVVTLLIQSSSATTMTTIGLVSAGLLTFPQGLSIVFGANIGTTGTAWLVALLGVRVSLTAAAMPIILAGALFRLLGKGRWSGAGSALAGLGLLLFGLTILQGGMGGLAERINPADLPAVLDGARGDLTALSHVRNIAALIGAGLLMTVLMQSSSAAIAVTLSALHAGAISADQAFVLIIGQNVGSAVSSAMAAIGATNPAKRTALGHVLLNVVSALLAIAALPLLLPAVARLAQNSDPTTLLAALNTAYKVGGVLLLLPVINRFAAIVERLLPQRGVVLTRRLDRSVLEIPAVAVESARRTIAEVHAAVCSSLAGPIAACGEPSPHHISRSPAGSAVRRAALLEQASEALHETRVFLSRLDRPASTREEQHRLTRTLHALDHASRLVDNARDEPPSILTDQPADSAIRDDAHATRAASLCARILNSAAAIAERVSGTGHVDHPQPAGQTESETAGALPEVCPTELSDLANLAAELASLRREHRARTLDEAGVNMSAEAAIRRVETVKRLDRVAYHAWRCAFHLSGRIPEADASGPTEAEPNPNQPSPASSQDPPTRGV
ncbi:MAG: Na/Pi cotransporter family protein [Phycisphaeraceae bacterium]|nr:Na/Pi cotransporter family protein [Phycisphaeraceae bacterium]